MTPAYRIRRGGVADHAGMADLMEASIRSLGPAHYAPDQVEVWAAAARDEVRFARLVHGAETWVAEEPGGLMGFSALQPGGYLSCLYVHPACGRRGIGSTLLTALLDHARNQGIDRVRTEASTFSRGVFEKAGFRVDTLETVERNGVTVQRARMSLPL